MATNNPNPGPSAPLDSQDLPPPYSAVVGNPQYGFVSPSGEQFMPAHGAFPQPKSFTAPGVYPHPTVVTNVQPHAGDMPPPPGMTVPVGVVLPVAVGSDPTTVTCYSCGKVVTTKVKYVTAWHTHLVAGSICFITMVVSVASNTRGPEVILDMETLGHPREPPPPYSPPNTTEPNQQIVYQTVILQPSLKSKPILFTCPNCHKRDLTKVKYVSSHKTHMLSGFICGFTVWCLLCCFAAIPYLIPTFKKAEHYCANCDIFLGSNEKCYG